MDRLNSDETAGAPLTSPICAELRSKKYYSLESIPLEPADMLDLSGHCWCHLTHQPVGPDGGFVHPIKCTSNRECYRSAFDPTAT